MAKLKIYTVKFNVVYSTGSCLVIQAENKKQAEDIARVTILHTDEFKVSVFKSKQPGVIEYIDGDY